MPQANRSITAVSPVVSLLRCAFLLAAFVMTFSCWVAAQTPHQAPQQVIIKQMRFQPSALNVKQGDTVEWKNEDIFVHTVTAYDGTFDSGLIAPGSSWKTTIGKTGTIAYHCRPHPNMTAQLLVQQPGEHAQSEHGAAHHEAEELGSLRWSLPKRPDEIHPILVNFTAALLPLALLSDLLGRIFRRQMLHAAGLWMMVYEAAITPLTVAAGWWWKSRQASALPAKLIMVHQWLGTTAGVLFILLAAWRWKFHKRDMPPSSTYLLTAAVVLLALIYQGSLGGAMVFGR